MEVKHNAWAVPEQDSEIKKVSEEVYKLITENITDLVAMCDFEANFSYVSPSYRHVLGYEPQELLGKPIYQNVHPEDLQGIQELISERYDVLEPASAVFRMQHKKGHYLWFESHGRIVFSPDGIPIGAVFNTREITERKRMEEAIKESEERYRFIAENVSDVLWTADFEGNFSFLSPAHKAITGYTVEDSKNLKIWDILTPDSALKVKEAILRRLNRNKEEQVTPAMIELEFRHKDGSTRICEVTVKFFFDENEPIGLIGITRDVTQRKKMEHQLQQAIKMQAIGTLAGGVAHDFNNLLMGVQGRTSIMLMDVDSNHPHYEHLKGIEEYVKSASDLARQLLGFAKVGKYEVKTTNPNDVLRKTVEMFGRTKKELVINIKYGDDVYPVDMDRAQIEQVILNLLVNAWQSMPGGGNLFIETGKTTLGHEYATSHQINPGHYSKISITDTGVGMDKATQSRIFEPFFTTKEMGRGTGLGLASVYGIIKNHNGIINVYSEVGRGTTFTIYLPASLRELGNEAEEKPVSLKKGSETILVVDDEKLITDVSRKMLEQLGYRVLTAESGEMALDIYKKKKAEIDLIILDMIMPQVTGEETFYQLKAINDEVKVILSSGYSLNDQAKRILARGCDGFLQKPFDIETMSQKLRKVLD